jgi:hypothetical protein
MNKNAQDVNSAEAENPRAVIGHNRPSLSEAAQANIETGVLLLCKEALITAIQDKRLQRPHLRVLAAIATHINTRTAKAWPSRMAIAIMADLSPKSVSNVVLQLRGWGYLVSDRETVEQADGKRLTVYTFGNIDHDGIRREIAAFVNRLREQRDPEEAKSSRPGGNSEVPPQQDVPDQARIPAPEGFPPEQEVPATAGTPKFPPQEERPAPTGMESSRQDGEFPPERERSSRQDGDSNSNKELIEKAAAAAPVHLVELRERLMGIAGDALANEASAPGLLHIGIVAGWIESGCDLELDIVPAVDARARAAIRTGKKIHSWSYFAQAVADAKAARTRPMPVGQAAGDAMAAKRERMRKRADEVEAQCRAQQKPWSGRK